MADTRTIILIALLVVGGLCLIVAFALTHHIGGFLRNVEREAQEEAEAEEARRGAQQAANAPDDTDTTEK